MGRTLAIPRGETRAHVTHAAVLASTGKNGGHVTFAKLKALPRKVAERTIGALSDRIGLLLNAFMPEECANYFNAAGYDAT